MRRIIFGIALAVIFASTMLILAQATPTPPPEDSFLELTVAGKTCHMALAGDSAATPEVGVEAPAQTPAEATAEATSDASSSADGNYTLVELGDDCADVIPHLYAPTNGTLWIALALPNEFPWQQFMTVADDPNPPKFDTRGRFVGCSNPDEGEHTCSLLWEHEGTTYRIDIPLLVGRAYFSTARATPTEEAISTPPVNSGVWGDCGSCTTCGGPVEHCVLAPDNTCVWDAERCEPKSP